MRNLLFALCCGRESDAERVFTMWAMIVGGAFYGYLIASIATIVTAQNANDQLYLERMDMIHTYMRIKRFPPRLRHRIHRYFKRYFSQRTALDENAILNDLEPALREEVGEYLIHDAVRRNYLFRELHPAVLGRIFSVFRPTSADVGAELATKGVRGDAMFVIESGSCELRVSWSIAFGVRRATVVRMFVCVSCQARFRPRLMHPFIWFDSIRFDSIRFDSVRLVGFSCYGGR